MAVLEGRLRLEEVEHGVCDLASKLLHIPRHEVSPGDRLIEDLRCDSLDLIDLIMSIEDRFGLSLPCRASDTMPHAVFKAVFTRQPFRLADLAEAAYLRQGTGRPERSDARRRTNVEPTPPSFVPFTQIGGRWERRPAGKKWLCEPLDTAGPVPQYRRRSGGMRCLLVPSAEVEIGSNGSEGPPDERPAHVVGLDSFLIDAEPVSTTAYCRFLNSVGQVSAKAPADWFVLDPEDDRVGHVLVRNDGAEWAPLAGAERWPMVLVSWYGAVAYSLWAHGRDWTRYDDESPEAGTFLLSEAQWEYAARGAERRKFPCGDEPPSPEKLNAGRHEPGATYSAESLPFADVNAEQGMSPFGLHHTARNVWQWCRDWYDPAFYGTPQARRPNPVNRTATGVRSERGGSWVGPAELCRSSFRRGRAPYARGRCLGFRCVGPTP